MVRSWQVVCGKVLSESPKMIVIGIDGSILESKRLFNIPSQAGKYPGELAMESVASKQSSFENSRHLGLTDSKPNLRDHSYFKKVGANGAEFLAK